MFGIYPELSNYAIHRMSAPSCQSKLGGFIERAASILASLPALIGDLFR
jgi:hypothetical protein